MGTRAHNFLNPVVTEDHPHACGDKNLKCFRHNQNVRIIPTRVGTRCCQYLSQACPRDHPHACGDKRKTLAQQYEAQGSSPRVWGQAAPANIIQRGVGSSPRVWGQEFVTLGLFAFARIIPTRMGTRVCYLGFVCLCQDHPHAYGDKQLSLTLSVMLRGSSPRVWGQVIRLLTNFLFHWIIPTRMGTSACHK